MKTKLLFLLFFLCANLVFSQADTTYFLTGEIKSISLTQNDTIWRTFFHKNGNKYQEGRITKNAKIGEWQTFYYSGKLNFTVHYLEGGFEHSSIGYFETGELKWRDTTINSKRECKSFYQSGILESWVETDPRRGTTQRYYYPSGALKKEAFFPPSGLGHAEHFYETGELMRTEEYTNRWMSGTWREFYKNQKLKQTEECVGGRFRDIREFYPNGKLKSCGRKNYYGNSNGSKTGEWKEYHKNGQLYKSYQYDNQGMKTGEWITYFDNGVIQEIGTYEEGKPMGFWKEYYRSGQLKNSGEYSKNVYRMEKCGMWKMYHKNGVLKRTSFHVYRGRTGEAR